MTKIVVPLLVKKEIIGHVEVEITEKGVVTKATVISSEGLIEYLEKFT